MLVQPPSHKGRLLDLDANLREGDGGIGRDSLLFFELVREDTGGTERTIPHSKITTLHY